MPDPPNAAPTDTTRAPWWVLPGLALAGEAIFAGAVVASCFVGDSTLRTTMFTGALTLGAMGAQYFFGSSAGSQKKDETIAASSAALAVSSPAPPAAAPDSPAA